MAGDPAAPADEAAPMTGHLCRAGLPWLMDAGIGLPRRVYLCSCGRTLEDPQAPAMFGDIEREVRAMTQRVQTVVDNVAAQWRAGVAP